MVDREQTRPEFGPAEPSGPGQPRTQPPTRPASVPAPRGWTAPVRAVRRRRTSNDAAGTTATRAAWHSGVVDCGLYVDGRRQPGSKPYVEALAEARRTPGAFVWLGLHQPSAEEMATIADAFDLHELAVEDAVKAAQRPKLEHFGDVAFLVLRTARYVQHTELTETSEVIETGQVMLFIGAQFVVSVRHGDACRLSPVRAELERKSDLLRHGPWAVAYAVTDRVVDLYLEVAAEVEQDLDAIEENVFSRDGKSRVQRIYQLKREIVEFRRAVIPLQRPMMQLIAEEGCDVPAEIRRYFSDVQDHLTRTVEQITSYDDLLNSILQARLAQVTVEQNDDMRKIAAWASIFAVQTTIAGIYGMNFIHMPELRWKYGYPLILTLMISAAFGMYRLFRRTGWL